MTRKRKIGKLVDISTAAPVVKQVDTTDLKSVGSKGPCRFKSGREHHLIAYKLAKSWFDGLKTLNPDVSFADLYEVWMNTLQKHPEAADWHLKQTFSSKNQQARGQALR